jgi:hypothetical protein
MIGSRGSAKFMVEDSWSRGAKGRERKAHGRGRLHFFKICCAPLLKAHIPDPPPGCSATNKFPPLETPHTDLLAFPEYLAQLRNPAPGTQLLQDQKPSDSSKK